jgi:hypothetical protein
VLLRSKCKARRQKPRYHRYRTFAVIPMMPTTHSLRQPAIRPLLGAFGHGATFCPTLYSRGDPVACIAYASREQDRATEPYQPPGCTGEGRGDKPEGRRLKELSILTSLKIDHGWIRRLGPGVSAMIQTNRNCATWTSLPLFVRSGSNSEVRTRNWAVRFPSRTDIVSVTTHPEKCQKQTNGSATKYSPIGQGFESAKMRGPDFHRD